MSTTACDDQLTLEPTFDNHMSDVSVRFNETPDVFEQLQTTTRRAESAEAELARLAQQKPVAWCDPVEFKDDPWSFQGFRCRTSNYPTMPLYAAPVPAPHKGATHCDDCGLTWLDDGLNPLGCPYCKDAAPQAPDVPNEIGLGKGEFVIWPVKIGGVHGLAFVKTNDPQAVGAFHAEPEDGQIELGAGDSVIHFGNAESAMVLAERLQYVIALLQSAEVQAVDKLQLTPAPTHPADRNAGEVRHD